MLLVVGASGFLGANVVLEALAEGREIIAASDSIPLTAPGVRTLTADLTAPGACSELLDQVRPEWVLNCAAIADVDKCERMPALAARVNENLPRALAAACAQFNARLLHVSTDAVFDGKHGRRTEEDPPGPVNEYAASKLAGERAVMEEMPDALVVRTNFVGIAPRSEVGLAGWIASQLEQGEVIKGFTNVIFAPLLANDLARILLRMMDRGMDGLFHAASRDSMSKYDFAVRFAKAAGFDASLVRQARLADVKLLAMRPLDTSLSPKRLEGVLGQVMPTVDEAIERLVALRKSDWGERLRNLTSH
jgi:dTDP-4-dehydrorhamnose reductase